MKLKNLIYGFLLWIVTTQLHAYILNNYYYIVNATNKVLEVSYNVCQMKKDKGVRTDRCYDNAAEILPHKSKAFYVNTEDNYFFDLENFLITDIYVYQATSNSSHGEFVRDRQDIQQFRKDYWNVVTHGFPVKCIINNTHSAILNDFNTGMIFCLTT